MEHAPQAVNAGRALLHKMALEGAGIPRRPVDFHPGCCWDGRCSATLIVGPTCRWDQVPFHVIPAVAGMGVIAPLKIGGPTCRWD